MIEAQTKICVHLRFVFLRSLCSFLTDIALATSVAAIL